MDNFSDDEKFEVEAILEQRKRKGVLEYLVQWKDAGGEDNTWEPAESIAANCALLIKNFLTAKKQKRSASQSRKTSRSKSRSRSSSRGRKATATKATRKSSRSRSKGRPPKKQVEKNKPAEEIEEKTSEKLEEKSEKLEEKSEAVVTNNTSVVTSSSVSIETATTSSVSVASTAVDSAASSPANGNSENMVVEKKESETPVQGRVLRSSTMAAREHLEVQRVHNEQRPVHEDDSKPRSSIWKVADYAVIALFILSVIAALFLFLEKFFDLEEFKKQAFPNMGLLKQRMVAGQQNLVEIMKYGVDRVTSVFTHLYETIIGSAHKETVSAKQ